MLGVDTAVRKRGVDIDTSTSPPVHPFYNARPAGMQSRRCGWSSLFSFAWTLRRCEWFYVLFFCLDTETLWQVLRVFFCLGPEALRLVLRVFLLLGS